MSSCRFLSGGVIIVVGFLSSDRFLGTCVIIVVGFLSSGRFLGGCIIIVVGFLSSGRFLGGGVVIVVFIVVFIGGRKGCLKFHRKRFGIVGRGGDGGSHGKSGFWRRLKTGRARGLFE